MRIRRGQSENLHRKSVTKNPLSWYFFTWEMLGPTSVMASAKRSWLREEEFNPTELLRGIGCREMWIRNPTDSIDGREAKDKLAVMTMAPLTLSIGGGCGKGLGSEI